MNRDRINNWLTFVAIAGLTAFTFGGCLAATNRPTVSDSPTPPPTSQSAQGVQSAMPVQSPDQQATAQLVAATVAAQVTAQLKGIEYNSQLPWAAVALLLLINLAEKMQDGFESLLQYRADIKRLELVKGERRSSNRDGNKIGGE